MRHAAISLLLSVVSLFTVSCASQKAIIDYSLSEGILWPGPPEKPRIKYLYSLRMIAGGENRGRLLRILAGQETDVGQEYTLIRPHGVFAGGGKLYITDPGAFCVYVVDEGTLETVKIQRAGNFAFLSPIGITADSEGRIYVSDSELRKVAVFNRKGRFIGFFEGDFARPTGIAINEDRGLLYVADTWAHVVHVYNLQGKRLRSIGERGEGAGKLNYPTHLSVDKDGYLYVSDTMNFMVQIFSPSDSFVNAFGLVGSTYYTFDKIKGIAVDKEGHIYVVDSAQDMVKIYDGRGNLLLFFGRKGHFYGEFYLPSGIYVDNKSRIFVSDSLNRRIQAFQLLGGD